MSGAEGARERIERELAPGGMRWVLAQRDAAYAAGWLHGWAGTIDEGRVLDPEWDHAYRQGLSAGRAAEVDAQLDAMRSDLGDAATVAQWTVTEYGASGAWVGEHWGRMALPGLPDAGVHYAANQRAFWWNPGWNEITHWRAEVAIGTVRAAVCAARQAIRPIRPGVEAEWFVAVVDGEHEHPARPEDAAEVWVSADAMRMRGTPDGCSCACTHGAGGQCLSCGCACTSRDPHTCPCCGATDAD
jgi:hypothetical protein